MQNLRNVAIPGTGIPLSWVARFRPVAFAFVVAGIPLVCVVAALRLAAEPEDRATHPGLVWPSAAKFAEKFYECLLNPRDWHSYWRLNCRLASFHALVSKEATKDDFALEDKWKFLTQAEAKDVPVTPFLRTPGVVCKHRNEEGGLGYCAFTNAASGGDWIIQERLSNAKALADLLPPNAPLSTLRVITASTAGLPKHLRNSAMAKAAAAEGDDESVVTGTPLAAAALPIAALRIAKQQLVSGSDSCDSPASILSLASSDFAAKKAKTANAAGVSAAVAALNAESEIDAGDTTNDEDEDEYDSEAELMADDDDDLRVLKERSSSLDGGLTNSMGGTKKSVGGAATQGLLSVEEAAVRQDICALSCVFRAGREGALTDHVNILFDVDGESGEVRKGTTNQHWYNLGVAGALKTTWVSTHDVEEHPDVPGGSVVGSTLPIAEIIETALKGHARLCPGVPLVGWDVAITAEHGMLLLEGNFSCNFFRGEFDELKYFKFVDRYFSFCDAQRIA